MDTPIGDDKIFFRLQVAALNMARDHISCCVYQNYLIAAGGYDMKTHPVDFVEIYDEKQNAWSHLRPLNKIRGRCAMFASCSSFETNRLT